MKTIQKLAALGFMVALFMAFGINAKAQTTDVTVINNTNCALEVGFSGDYGSVTCGIEEAEGEVVNLLPGNTAVVNWVPVTSKVPPTGAYLRAALAAVMGNPSVNAESASCLGPAVSNGTSACATAGINVTITVTGAGQLITIN